MLRTWGENLARLLERDRIGHGGAHPERAFVEMRHELSADEGYEQKRGGEDQGGHEHGRLRVIEAPLQLARIFVAHPFKGLVHALVHAVFEPVGAHDGNERERQDQRADKCDRHRIGHRLEEFSGWPAERVDRQIARDDDGDGIEDRAIDVLRRRQDHLFRL